MTDGVERSRRRPFGVWLICAFYLLSSGWVLLSYALIYSGAIEINSAQEAYFASLTRDDWLYSLYIGVINFSGAVFLFLLRRVAVVLFSVAFVLSLVVSGFQIAQTNWTEALPSGGLVGVLLGWLISVAIILYARSLARKGVLS